MPLPHIETNKFEFRAMDTTITIKCDAPEKTTWKSEIKEWFLHFEKIASRFDESSFLSDFNRIQKGTWVFLDRNLFLILYDAFEFAKRTDFYFNPFIGTRLEQLGYNKSFLQITEENMCDIQSFSNLPQEPLVFEPTINAVKKDISEKIDLGGIGKGWSVDKAVKQLKGLDAQSGYIDAGGDIALWGDEFIWMGIADPKDEDKDIAQFEIKSGAIATSNKIYRTWKQGNIQRHHIINGKTGFPSESDIVQATVFASSVAQAEVISKVLCMHSFDNAIHWLEEKFPHAGCILINDERKIAMNKKINNYVKRIEF